MAITLSGSGGFFTRCGHLFNDILNINSLRGGVATTPVTSAANLATRLTATILPDYANGTAIPQIVDGSPAALAAYQATAQSWCATLAGYAKLTLQAMYGIDQMALSSKAPLTTFQQVALASAMKELIRQMIAASASVQAATVSAGAQTAVGSPTGNPIIVVSLKNGQGYLLQLPFPETIGFKCSSDSQGTATAGNELVSVIGQAGITDPLNQLYPGGSGLSASLNAVDGSKYLGSTGNMLNNSDFATYTTANYPDNWSVLVGTAGTQVLNGSASQNYTTGGGSLEFLGDVGTTLTSVCQPFKTTPSAVLGVGGTSQTLLPDTVYHFNGWVKTPTTPAAGVVKFQLIDGTNTVINDDQATANSVTLDLNAMASTSWTAINGSFRTPSVLPSTVKFNIALTTAITSTKTVFFGRFSFVQPNSANGGNGLYPGGPFCSIHSGNVNLVNGLTPDQWTIAIANSYKTSTSGLMQLMMDRVFGLRTLATPALQLPYAGSPSLADTLIA